MALQYKLEYLKDGSDDSVFIHFRVNVPVYANKMEKETYETGTFQHDWLDGIFNTPGITDASSQVYRLWIVKSPSFQWDEILPPLLTFVQNYLGESSLEEMQGSGITLESSTDRRGA
jgi:hypothetical protein